MRYFHRTSLSIDEVLAEADQYFGTRAVPGDAAGHTRVFTRTVGRISVDVRAEGGHYTLVTVETDQVGESEADRLAKRFLAVVHKRAQPDHVLRGAY
ncbi:MAG: hypothetical protein ACE5HT_00425 [Gemmatimonadales bacterium]